MLQHRDFAVFPSWKIIPQPQSRNYNLNRLTFLNKDLQFLEGPEEFFHGNSRITSDCWVGSILKTLSSCLYASRELFGVRLLVMAIRVNCAVISAMLRSSTPVKSYNSYEDSEEGIISFERTKINHDKLPCENNSIIITCQITLHIICISF